jgi:hypothetical protein
MSSGSLYIVRGAVKKVLNTKIMNIPSIIDKIILNMYSCLGSVIIYIISSDF